MSKNKDIRKKIAGQLKAIAEHESKIAAELAKSNPDQILIAIWQKHIANARVQIAKLERQLKK